MTALSHPTTLVTMLRPRPDVVRNPGLLRETAQAMLDESRHQAPERRGPHWPIGSLFLPVERATEEFQQLFGRRPSIYEVAAGVAARPDLVDPVHPSALRWRGPTAPHLTDSWFVAESAGDWPLQELERAAIAGALLECLGDWEEQVLRSRVELHMTQVEITHALAFSQLRACTVLARGVEQLDAAPRSRIRW